MTNTTKRLRVFAGPNGSGKSTIINKIRNTRVSGSLIDFGIYVNADDIAVALRTKKLHFKDYDCNISEQEFVQFAIAY